MENEDETDVSLSTLDPQKEKDILRSIVLNRIESVERENERLRGKEMLLNVIKQYVMPECDCCHAKSNVVITISCENCFYEDVALICNSEKCKEMTLKSYQVLYVHKYCSHKLNFNVYTL